MEEWQIFIRKNIRFGPDVIIYLRTTPMFLEDRLRKRNRDAESLVSLNYLQQLHSCYENCLGYIGNLSYLCKSLLRYDIIIIWYCKIIYEFV